MVNGTELITARGIRYNDHVFFLFGTYIWGSRFLPLSKKLEPQMQISCSGVLYSLIFVQLVSTLLTVYESQFITAFTIVPQWSIPWPGWTMSTHYFFKIHFHTKIPSIPKSLKWFSFQVSRIRSIISIYYVVNMSPFQNLGLISP
jgi:hypothetical protein